ncbi:MAG TPA: hypothetical protein DFS52_22935, partial [Myxococcales bacterium]|nr:hypothetical protein [Myxococcales bacterium]
MQPKPRILVVDANRAVASELKRHLESAAMEVEVADCCDAALQRVRHAMPDLVIYAASGPDADLCHRAKEIVPGLQALLLFEPGEDRGAEERVESAGADGYLVGPIKRGSLVSCVRLALRVRDLAQRAAQLEGEADKRIEAPYDSTSAPPQADFNFFKRLLLLEVKRARRYRFPLAFLMIGIDHFREAVESLDRRDQARMIGRLMTTVVEGIRGVDLCVLFAEDKLLVYLPHTGRGGAQQAAERLREKLREARGPLMTVSIGISAYEGCGSEVSFGGLLKEAGEALRAAQEKGGDRLEGGEQRA